MEIHNCSTKINENYQCSMCGKDFSHKVEIKNYFDALERALQS